MCVQLAHLLICTNVCVCVCVCVCMCVCAHCGSGIHVIDVTAECICEGKGLRNSGGSVVYPCCLCVVVVVVVCDAFDSRPCTSCALSSSII